MPIVPPKPEPINPMVALGLGKIMISNVLQYNSSRKVMPIVPPKPEPINPMVALGLGKIMISNVFQYNS